MDRMDTSDAPKETSTGEMTHSIIPPDTSIAQPTPLPGQPITPPEGGDVFTGLIIPPPTFPPHEIAPLPGLKHTSRTSAAEAITSLVNVQADTPKANWVYTGPIKTPTPDPLTFFSQQAKKPKKSESNVDSDIKFLDDAQVQADTAKCALDQLMEDILKDLGSEYIHKDEGLRNVQLLDNRKYKGHHCTPPRITLRQF
ncbi:hypothetical protein FRB99_000365 [Tulasnella sp. 403]|nr:hypothetical protein FRB99_000365 [Tulasnella sp. 403]